MKKSSILIVLIVLALGLGIFASNRSVDEKTVVQASGNSSTSSPQSIEEAEQPEQMSSAESNSTPVSTNAEPTIAPTPAMTDEQRDSITMLNYIVVLTQKINAAKNNRLYLEEARDEILDNYRPSRIDKDTQEYLTNLLKLINNFRMNDIKRDRLRYIYEQNRGRAILETMPNPLVLLSSTSSHSLPQLVMSIGYMAIDSYKSYASYTEETNLDYLKEGWVLDDYESEQIANIGEAAFNYTVNMVNENGLNDNLVLDNASSEEFAKYRERDMAGRISFYKENQQVYQAFGGYWLARADSYYEHREYKECLDCIAEYEALGVDIFKADKEYLSLLPKVIAAASQVRSEADYISIADKYAGLIKTNRRVLDWTVSYCAAETYIDLYSKTGNESYLRYAYDLAAYNVRDMIPEQQKQNKAFLANLSDIELPISLGTPEEEAAQIKAYNTQLKEHRKTELCPVYDPLFLNLELLFGISDELELSDDDKETMDEILQGDGSPLFLDEALNNTYKFNRVDIDTESIDVSYTLKGVLSLPVKYACENARIVLSAYRESPTEPYTTIEDWTVASVERKTEGDIQTFKATFQSKDVSKLQYHTGDLIKIEVFARDSSQIEPLTFMYKINSIERMGIENALGFSSIFGVYPHRVQ